MKMSRLAFTLALLSYSFIPAQAEVQSYKECRQQGSSQTRESVEGDCTLYTCTFRGSESCEENPDACTFEKKICKSDKRNAAKYKGSRNPFLKSDEHSGAKKIGGHASSAN